MEFDERERTIIEAGSYIKGHKYDLWGPEKGITNVYESTPFEDPEGLLTLSLK